MNLYELLGIKKKASPTEIQAAYRRKMKEHHPDRGGDPKLAKDLGQAYAILMNPHARLRYDQTAEIKLGTTNAAARDILTAKFLEWLFSGEVSYGQYEDPIQGLKSWLTSEISAAKKEISKIEKTVERAKKRLSRLKSKSTWLLERLEFEVDKGLTQKENIQAKLETIAIMETLLIDLSFEVEIPKQSQDIYKQLRNQFSPY